MNWYSIICTVLIINADRLKIMKNLKNIIPLLLSAGALVAFMFIIIPGIASAQSADTCDRNPANCGTGRTVQPGSGNGAIDENNPIMKKVILPFSQGLAALVGVVVVLSIVISGIQYSSARDNPQMVAAAKNRIVMSLLALLLLMFAGSILNWITPGGLFQ